eukprot:m.147308 g.147308  ORF g.147308 m.147308 type:complete len:207 (+) comp13241_c0_seq9:39-659(+)
MRVKFASNSGPDIAKSSEKKGSKGQGTSRAISQFIDPSLCWEDLEWLRGVTSLPIVLKGVQCAEDAILAVEHGVAGIVLSNHGGRQLDFARSSVEVLVEVMDELQKRNMQGKLEVYVDGGIRRGSDVVKAIALGAKAVRTLHCLTAHFPLAITIALYCCHSTQSLLFQFFYPQPLPCFFFGLFVTSSFCAGWSWATDVVCHGRIWR